MYQGAFSRLLRMVGAVGCCGIGLTLLLAGSVGDALAADLTGRKGLGGSVGTSLMIGDSEFRAHARPRLTGDALFRYGIRPRWVFVAFFGYGWNAYTNEERWLSDAEFRQDLVDQGYLGNPHVQEKVVVMAPFTGGIEYRFGKDVWVPYAGVGGGIYQLQILHNGSVAQDPRDRVRHRLRRYDFGLYLRSGIEQFLTESVSLDYEALGHIVFSKDREKFPPPSSQEQAIFGRDFRAYGGDTQLVQIRMGIRYYWGE